ncbi:MAG TPA: single-stranded DNA-binding protein [Terriglobia bacterium]|nr:single-stranded DNA-binding protein [Terriglobia bacterium]
MQTNRFELSGYLAAKPAARSLPSGTVVANARLGQTYQYETKDGPKKHTNWFNLAFYNDLAEIALTYDKGDNVSLIGTLQQRQFTPKDGSPRTVYEVIVQRSHLVYRPRNGSAQTTDNLPFPESMPIIEPVEASAPSQEEADAWAIL